MPPVNPPVAITVFRPGDTIRFKPEWVKGTGLDASLSPMRGRITKITQAEDWEVARVQWTGGYFGLSETSALTRNLQRLEADQWLP